MSGQTDRRERRPDDHRPPPRSAATTAPCARPERSSTFASSRARPRRSPRRRRRAPRPPEPRGGSRRARAGPPTTIATQTPMAGRTARSTSWGRSAQAEQGRAGKRHGHAPLDEPLDDDVLGIRARGVDRPLAHGREHRLECRRARSRTRATRRRARSDVLATLELDQSRLSEVLAATSESAMLTMNAAADGARRRIRRIGARTARSDVSCRASARPSGRRRRAAPPSRRASPATRSSPARTSAALTDESTRHRRVGRRARRARRTRRRSDRPQDDSVEQRREVPRPVRVELARPIEPEHLLGADRHVRERAERHQRTSRRGRDGRGNCSPCSSVATRSAPRKMQP